jgi:hypothetical protein
MARDLVVAPERNATRIAARTAAWLCERAAFRASYAPAVHVKTRACLALFGCFDPAPIS